MSGNVRDYYHSEISPPWNPLSVVLVLQMFRWFKAWEPRWFVDETLRLSICVYDPDVPLTQERDITIHTGDRIRYNKANWPNTSEWEVIPADD